MFKDKTHSVNLWPWKVSESGAPVCVPGGCSSFHVASVPGSDFSSVSAAVWAAPSRPGTVSGHQTEVGTKTPRSNLLCLRFYCPLCKSIQMCASNICVFCFVCALADLLLRGDYRTGKRLNMRKVIPYIASQFRKDKIWLRRTKPSKREYQICLAIDDSSSMVDNHSKQVTLILLKVYYKL